MPQHGVQRPDDLGVTEDVDVVENEDEEAVGPARGLGELVDRTLGDRLAGIRCRETGLRGR